MNWVVNHLHYLIIAALFFYIIAIVKTVRKRNRLKRYVEVQIGMPETEMIRIMGNDFNKSSLRNNRCKYEWRFNAMSSGHSYRGSSYRVYQGVRKVDIYVRNGRVEEIRPFNV